MATFILVHGTFATAASWPDLEAGLIQTAHDANEKANFERIAWTGKNRARARQTAGEMILARVTRTRSASVTEKIFIIGHSHGGSAISYFLKSYPETAKTLSGCAFLSTPFIAIRPRQNVLQLYYVMGISISASLLALALYLTIGGPKPFHQDYVVLIYGAASLLVALALWLGYEFVARKGLGDRLQEKTIREQTADLPKGNYLFLRCSGDEAAAALSAAQFIVWASIKVNAVARLHLSEVFAGGAIRRLLQTIILLFVFSICSFYAIDLLKVAPFTILPAVLLAVFSILTCAFLLGVVGALSIFVLQAAMARAFGWTDLMAGLLVELAIEPLPFGPHSLVHIDWNSPEENLQGFVHSWTYAHPIAIDRLQEWVHGELR
jgi:hypothetical protein